MSSVRYQGKSRKVAIILAFVLGVVGGHRFYLGDIRKGIAYALLFWSLIPAVVSLYDMYKYASREDLFDDPTLL